MHAAVAAGMKAGDLPLPGRVRGARQPPAKGTLRPKVDGGRQQGDRCHGRHNDVRGRQRHACLCNGQPKECTGPSGMHCLPCSAFCMCSESTMLFLFGLLLRVHGET